MTTGDELGVALASVIRAGVPGFDVVDLLSAPGFKIGRDERNAVVLLTPPDTNPEPPTELRRIALAPRIRLAIRFSNGVVEEGDYGLLQLKLGESEYLVPFLHVVANLIHVIGPSPAPGEVSIAMRRLVKLFDLGPPPRSSVLGLWGELLVLCLSSDPGSMMDAWHASIDAKFDYAANASRLEVKTSTGLDRKHIFSLEQLLPVSGASSSVVSIMTTETLAGTSVEELIQRAQSLFTSDASRQMRIHEIVAETLGDEWARSIGRRFDEVQAVESLAVLSSTAIPRVGEVPLGVTGVNFTSDCRAVAVELNPAGLAGLLSPQSS